MIAGRVLLAFALSALVLWLPPVFKQVESSPDFPSMAGVVNLIGRESDSAHGCAISPTVVVTNMHVTGENGENVYRYSTNEGQEGILAPSMVVLSADLATLTPKAGGPLKTLARVAANAPAVGSELFWVGYDWDTRPGMFARTNHHGKVSRVVAGLIVIDAETPAGTSGGCVINSAGETVGVIAWGRRGEQDHKEATIAVGIYGDWTPRPKGGA